MHRFRSSLGLVVVLCIVASTTSRCRTPNPASNTSAPGDGWSPEQLLETISDVRDRAFETPPSYKRTSLSTQRPRLSEAAAADRRIVVDALFDLAIDRAAAPANRWSRFARYHSDSHRIDWSDETDDRRELRPAFVSAIVAALDARHFDDLPRADSWNRSLAHRAVRAGDSVLVATHDLLRARGHSISVEQLASRPDLAGRLPRVTSHLSPHDEADPIESGDELKRRLTAFTMREGFALAAALYRSNGWSGVELLRSQPPASTADVVQPGRWMKGRPRVEWSWPEPKTSEETEEVEWSTTHTGSVGPAVVAVWLTQTLSPRRARTIDSGWSGDAYRRLERGETDGAMRFEWLSHWQTPSAARQVADAFETALEHEYPEDDASTTRSFGVDRHELVVAVTIGRGDAETLQHAAEQLADTDADLIPRRGLPTRFQPTRPAAFRQISQRADRRDGAWVDPAAGVRVDLEPVASWAFRTSHTPPLRWFVRHDDGVLIEMSVELADPLSPDFGTEAHLEQLRRRFPSGLEGAEMGEIERRDTPLDPTLTFQLSGIESSEANERRLRVWQCQRGDVRITISYQAPSTVFDSHLSTARTLVESLEPTSPPGSSTDASGDDADSDGIIQFETESD
jgi:hypothetical protein